MACYEYKVAHCAYGSFVDGCCPTIGKCDLSLIERFMDMRFDVVERDCSGVERVN